jgi:glycosyltransferase involved in cell wall biosynthesis
MGVNDSQVERIKAAIPEMKFLEYPNNKGKGHALRTGVQNSKSELTIFTDVDFPYETDSVVEVYRQLCNGTDIVLGYREQDYYAKVPLFRRLLSRGLRWVLKSMLKLSITDTQCGLKGFNKSGKQLFLATTIDRFLFDLEFVMLSSKDPTISTEPVLVRLRDGVVFSKVNLKVLLVELANLFTLTFPKRKPSPHA